MKAGIAGAGILGRLLAFALKNSGWEVTLFDIGAETSCSYAAAGLLTHITELEKNDLIIYQLGEEALTHHWPQLFAQLSKKIYFQQMGTLVFAHPQDQTELTHFTRMLADKLGNKKVYEHLHKEQIIALEPQITKFQNGLFFPDEGQLDSQTLMSELGDQLKDITWYHDTYVQAIRQSEIVAQDRTYRFDCVFDCRGLGAKSSFSNVRSVRGEIIWLHAPDVAIQRPIRLMHPRYSLYLVPRPNETYLIGASEIEANDQSPISVRAVLELLSAAYSIHPGFCEARMIKAVTHCRPTLTNHLPCIKYADGIVAINGLYRHGYLIAPTLIAEVMQWLKQGINSTRYHSLWEKFV